MGGTLVEISAEISASRALPHSIFICGANFFQVLIKSTVVGNKTTFVVFKQHDPQSVADLSGVAGEPLLAPGTPQTEKNYVFWGSAVENGSPSTIWGVKCCRKFFFLSSNKKCPLFVKEMFFYI